MKDKSIMDSMMQVLTKLAGYSKNLASALILLAAVYAADAATFTVSKTADTNDMVCNADCSLREAITAANSAAGNDTVIFAAGANGTITLSSGLPAIAATGSLTITGNGAFYTIISGNNLVRPFVVNGSAILTLSELTVMHGRAGDGGAVLNFGTLTVIDSSLSDNAASGSGGAIANLDRLIIIGSTLSGNDSSRGGAIYLQDADATLTNTTISGNTATSGAGAVTNLSGAGRSGSLTMNSCTVTGNSGSTTGGVTAFDNGGSASVTTTLKNTIFAINSPSQLYSNGGNSSIVSQGYNLTSDNGGGYLTGPGDKISTNPLLGPLADNGGETLTHELLAGSPAVDAGTNSNGLTSDQRGGGYLRTFDLASVNIGDGTDIGAYEVQIEPDLTAPVIIPNVSGIIGTNGWYTSDVVVSWSVTDPESVVSTHPQCASQTVASDTSGVTFTCQASSAGGTSSQSVFVKRDGSTPTITFASKTAANANGWNNTNVAVQWNCVDFLSGAATPTVSNFVFTEGADQSSLGICTDNAGNVAQNAQAGINIDKTAPQIAFASPTPAANANGWNNSNVSVNWTCSDAGSGAVEPTVSQTVSSEGRNQSAAGTCVDLAGNSASSTQAGINIDKTAPSIAFLSRTPPPNTNGWNNTDVVVNWNCNDTLSQVASASVSQTVSGEGANSSAIGTCADLAGNSVSDTQSGINIDKTTPTIAFDSRTTPNAKGWNNTNVLVNWNCSDSGSGAVTPSASQSVSSEGSNLSSTGTCADLAGNSASNTQTGIKIDKTAPNISFVSRTAANGNGWNSSDVTVTWSCSDALSGAVNPGVNQTITSEGSGQSAIGTCSDSAGNSASNTQSGVNIDKTAPTLSPAVTPNPVLAGATAAAAANATDILSGIASQSCPSVDTSTVGTKLLSCTATDLAGNTNTASFSYQVNSRFNFAGFFQPVENLPTINVVNAGQAVPMKFSLGGYHGLNIFAPGFPISTLVACDANEPGTTIEETVNSGGSTLSYDPSTGQYSYVWKTDKAWRGTCRIFALRLSDGSEYYAKFRFR